MTKESRISCAVFLSFFLLGSSITIWGVSIEHVVVDYSITLKDAGMLLSIMSFGRMISVFLSGVMSDRYGYIPAICVGILFLAQSFLAAFMGVPFWGLCISMFIAGMGHGTLDTSGASAIMWLHEKEGKSKLNHIQTFFGVGSLCAPLLAVSLYRYTTNWRLAFLALGIFGTVLFLIVYLGNDSQKNDIKQDINNSVTNVVVLSNQKVINPNFLLGILISIPSIVIFVYSGIGIGINTWLPTFFSSVNGSTEIGALGLSFYNVGLTIGAVVCRLLTQKYNNEMVMSFMTIMSLLFFCVTLFSGVVVLQLIFIMLTGMTLGGLYTLALGIEISKYKEISATITGILATLAGLGSLIISFLSNILTEKYGVIIVYRSYLFLFIILFLCGIIINIRGRKTIIS